MGNNHCGAQRKGAPHYFALTPLFDVVMGEVDGAKKLGKPELIRRALPEKFERAAMVGDRKFDVLGAKEFGMDCVGVEFFGYAEPGELAEAGAVAVVQTPEELETFILDH